MKVYNTIDEIKKAVKIGKPIHRGGAYYFNADTEKTDATDASKADQNHLNGIVEALNNGKCEWVMDTAKIAEIDKMYATAKDKPIGYQYDDEYIAIIPPVVTKTALNEIIETIR